MKCANDTVSNIIQVLVPRAAFDTVWCGSSSELGDRGLHFVEVCRGDDAPGVGVDDL